MVNFSVIAGVNVRAKGRAIGGREQAGCTRSLKSLMSYEDIEPLEPTVWLLQLKNLALRSLDERDELERALRHALHLAQLTPRPLRHLVSCGVAEDLFEELLKGGAFELAALALVGDRLGLRLVRASAGSPAEAEVWFHGEEEGASCSDPSLAIAILQAWLACLAALDRPAVFNRMSARRPSLHKARSGRRPHSTEH
jgi:hypothetical protein